MPRAPKRSPRRAPKREYDPYDQYSTWDVRIARTFFAAFVLCALIIVIGIWGSIIGAIWQSGKWEAFLKLPISAQIFIYAGIITAHLFLLVLFYIVFRGGKLRLLKIMFKDRLVAKKYEDFQALRFLIAVTLIGVYIMIVAFLIWLLPLAFFESAATIWTEMLDTFNPGNWILYFGFMSFIFVLVFFFCFVLWNHGVYAVLRRVKRIEEEDEIKVRIKKEILSKADKDELMEEYKNETGKNPLYRNKETKGFMEWKKQKLG